MASGVQHPSVAQILDIAQSLGIPLTEPEALEYRGLMGAGVRYCSELERLPEYRPPVEYPRTPGSRPEPRDNPHNAWYWRSEIQGAGEGPLKGYTVGIKDAICVAGVPAMNGSRVLEGYIPDVDATVVTRLLDAGATIVGKTNTEDMSMSGGGHTCALGPVRNPHKPSHAAGGSSGGSAAALAAGDVDLALGGDQGGSIRIPASWCGVVGLKASYGLVPYTGCMMIEMTMDHVGPMARTVEDCARMLNALAGPDPLDPRQRGVIPADYVRDYLPAIGRGAEGLRIGVVKEGFGHEWPEPGLPPSEGVVDAKVREACRRFERLGAQVDEVSIPMHLDGVAIWTVMIMQGTTEFMIKGNGAGTNWSGFYNTGLAEAFARGWQTRAGDAPPTVKVLALFGEYLSRHYHGRYYAKTQNLRQRLVDAYDQALASYDILAMPSVTFRATELPPSDCSITEYVQHAATAVGNTCQFCITGHPSISVPCGMVDGLPVGLMLTGRHFEDFTVLQAADAFEKLGDWREM